MDLSTQVKEIGLPCCFTVFLFNFYWNHRWFDCILKASTFLLHECMLCWEFCNRNKHTNELFTCIQMLWTQYVSTFWLLAPIQYYLGTRLYGNGNATLLSNGQGDYQKIYCPRKCCQLWCNRKSEHCFMVTMHHKSFYRRWLQWVHCCNMLQCTMRVCRYNVNTMHISKFQFLECLHEKGLNDW